jgi:hypothetical protein
MTMTPASAKHPRRRGAGGEDRDVQAGRVGDRGVLDDDLPVMPRQCAARRSGGGKEAQLVDRERALGEEASHDTAHLPGGADHADPQPAHRPLPP